MNTISPRLLEVVEALPLFPGIRVLEIGCGPGVAAREIAKRIGDGHILAIDRSAKSIELAIKSSQILINSGTLSFSKIAIEKFELQSDQDLFDIAFGIRVGALDGRHPNLGAVAIPKIVNALKPNGKLFIDGGEPLIEIPLNRYR